MGKTIRYYRLRPGRTASFFYRILLKHLRRTRCVPRYSQCVVEAAQLAARLSLLSSEIGLIPANLVLCENYKIVVDLCGNQDSTARNELGLPFQSFSVPGWRVSHGAPIADLLERE
jgi:hypothetical protein